MADKKPKLPFEPPEELGGDWGVFRLRGTVRAKASEDGKKVVVVHGDGKAEALDADVFNAAYIPVAPNKLDNTEYGSY